MKSRLASPSRLAWITVGISALLAFAAWRTHAPGGARVTGWPPGQSAYLWSKYFGLFAGCLLLLHGSISAGTTLRRRGALLPGGTRAHRLVGGAVLLVATLHAAGFIIATSQRSGTPSLHALLPTFGAGHYQAMVSLGALSLYALLILAVCGALAARRTFGTLAARLHRALGLAVLPMVMLHALSIGSETRSAPVLIFVVSIMAILLLGSLRRPLARS